MTDQKPVSDGAGTIFQQFKSVLPSWHKLFLFSILAVVFLYLLSGVYVVQPNEQGVVRRFGRLVDDRVMPGIHYHLPWPVERVDRPKTLQVKVMSVGFRMVDKIKGIGPLPEETQMLTGDENIIDIQMIVQYRVTDPSAFLFSAEEPQWLVRKAAESSLTSIVGSMGVDQVLTTEKLVIENKLKEQVQTILDRYGCGLQISGAYFQDIGPSEEVAFAFRDVTSAREDRNRLINEAHGYRNEKLPQIRGQAEQMIRQAEAHRTERVNRASGEADRFLSLLREYEKNRGVTETRLYVETMEEILPKMRKYVLGRDEQGGVVNMRVITPQKQ
jgi:membrane protease subunit HflK